MEDGNIRAIRKELTPRPVTRPAVAAGLEAVPAVLAVVLLLAAGCLWQAVLVAAAAIVVIAVTWIYLQRTTEALLHNYMEAEREAKTWMLLRLLEGETLPQEMLSRVFVEGPMDCFVLIQIGIVDAAALEGVEEESLFYQEDVYLRHVFKPVLDGKGSAYFIPRADCLCIVECVPEPADADAARQLVAELCELTAGCLEQIRREIGLQLGGVVSTVHEGTGQLQTAWQEVCELTAYAELMGDQRTVKNACTDLDAPQTLAQRRQRMDLEKQYMAQISARDYRRAGQILEELLDAELPMATRNPEMLKSRLIMRLEQMLNSLCVSLDDYDAAALPLVEKFRAAMEAQTVEEIRQGISAVAEAAAEFADHAASSNSARVNEALNFIRENYADPNMGAALLSEKLGISASWLSRIIRQATGVGIVDCIHAERIRAAKELLTGTTLSIDEIAEQVGFSNRWTFTRSFKRYEGTTPGAWRDAQKLAG